MSEFDSMVAFLQKRNENRRIGKGQNLKPEQFPRVSLNSEIHYIKNNKII